MSLITHAAAYANNQVAFVAWHVGKVVAHCVGFEVTRLYADGTERVVAAWVPFKGQTNPQWKPQDTSVWPVQKFCWRDLTVRVGRDGSTLHAGEVVLRYRVRPLVLQAAGKKPVPAPAKKDYEGDAVPLSYFDDGAETPPVRVTQFFAAAPGQQPPEFQVTFTNGILSSQGLAKRLSDLAGKPLTATEQSRAVSKAIKERGDAVRERLAGDVLPAARSMFARAEQGGGRLRLALYELNDPDLVALLVQHAQRVEVILSTAGHSKASGAWDTTNKAARQALIDAKVPVHHRMFNTEARIGHNKFVVLLDAAGKPEAALMGSMNWTATGVCGQSNNVTIITHAEVAGQFNQEWEALKADTQELAVQGTPANFAQKNNNVQTQTLRMLNAAPLPAVALGQGTATVWFSPNTKNTTKGKVVPPDLQVLYSLMRKAQDAILFAVFQPAMKAQDGIVHEAIELGRKDASLLVYGAVSDRSAMPLDARSVDRDGDGDLSEEEQANTYANEAGNVQVVLATALGQDDLVSNFEHQELLTTGKAIIHDKIVVIDPLSETDCVAAFGSHNLGLKASYCNDENLVIIRGHRDVVLAYAVHVLDVWEHYRFRAIQVENREQGRPTYQGFLETENGWMKRGLKSARTRLSDYFAGVKKGVP